MSRRKVFSILLHVLWWFLLFVIFRIVVASMYYPVVRFEGNPFQILWAMASTFVVCILSFYGTFLIIHKYQSIHNAAIHNFLIISLIIFLSCSYFYALIWLYYEGDLSLYIEKYQVPFRTPPYLAVLPATLFSIIGLVFQRYHHVIKQKEREETLLKEKLELELGLLKSQLNPHFLFNTLNNIEHLVRKSPQQASGSIIKLSSLLRYQVYDTPEGKVTIRKDFQMIEDYLSLQSARIDRPEIVILESSFKNTDTLIEPALFLPFIENAFKHTDFTDPFAYIKMNMIGTDNLISFSIENSKTNDSTILNSSGVGLTMVRKRLELCYGGHYQLDVEDLGRYFSVKLQIKIT